MYIDVNYSSTSTRGQVSSSHFEELMRIAERTFACLLIATSNRHVANSIHTQKTRTGNIYRIIRGVKTNNNNNDNEKKTRNKIVTVLTSNNFAFVTFCYILNAYTFTHTTTKKCDFSGVFPANMSCFGCVSYWTHKIAYICWPGFSLKAIPLLLFSFIYLLHKLSVTRNSSWIP